MAGNSPHACACVARTKEAVLAVEKHVHAAVSWGPRVRITLWTGGAMRAIRHFLPTSLDQWMADTIADECGSSSAPVQKRVLVEQPASEHARTNQGWTWHG